MSVVYWKLIHYPRVDEKTWGSGVTISDYKDIKVNIKTGTGKDSFSFKYKSDAPFDVATEDKIDIYRKVNDNSSFTDDDLIMRGVVRTATPNKSGAINEVSVAGYNYSESVMSALIFVDATNLTIPVMFQQAINSLQLSNSVFTVTWDSTNPTTLPSGAPFPVVGERVYNKAFSQTLDKYSAKDKTDDVNYYWFINKDNELSWKRTKGTVENFYDEATFPTRTLKANRDTNEVKNFVVVKGGLDPLGRVLQERYADYVSIGKHGFKYYILTDETATTDNVQDADKAAAGVDDMADASYPFTPYWSSVACTSFNGLFDGTSYVNLLRTYLRDILKGVGKTFVDNRRYGKLKIDVSVSPEFNSFVVGSLVGCTFVDATLPSTDLRVEEINYSTFNDGIVFIEDEGSL